MHASALYESCGWLHANKPVPFACKHAPMLCTPALYTGHVDGCMLISPYLSRASTLLRYAWQRAIRVLWMPACYKPVPFACKHAPTLCTPALYTGHVDGCMLIARTFRVQARSYVIHASALYESCGWLHANSPYLSRASTLLRYPCQRVIPPILGHIRSLASMPPRYTAHPWA